MSKMSELSTAVAELHRCGEALIEISQTLREIFSGDEPVKAEPAAQPQLSPPSRSLHWKESGRYWLKSPSPGIALRCRR